MRLRIWRRRPPPFAAHKQEPGNAVSFGAGCPMVPGDADAAADCANEKGLQMQASLKLVKGFEPSTFCMATRTSVSCSARISPANAAIDSEARAVVFWSEA
jgi:hypothetical protein